MRGSAGRWSALIASIKHARSNHTIAILFWYHVILYVIFMFIYRYVGLKHVILPEGSSVDFGTAAYYAAVTQYSYTPPGEMPPIDKVGRAIIGLHITLSWLSIFWAVFSIPAFKRKLGK